MSTTRRAFPARLADLAFALDVPADFVAHELPGEDTDLSDPSLSAPLAVLSSPVAAAVVSVAARPAYDDGSVLEWSTFLLAQAGITPTSLMPGTVGSVRLDFAWVEDGGRLVTLNTLCPAQLWPSFGDVLQRALRSFELDEPRGPRAPLAPGAPVRTLAEIRRAGA